MTRLLLAPDGWTCPRCGATNSSYFHECPNCSIGVARVLRVAAVAILLCAAPALATPGDVQDPETGEWGQPEKPCNGGCDPKPERPDLPRDTGDGKTRRPATEGYLCTATWQGKRVIFQHGEVEPGAEPVGECFCTSHPVGEVMTPWPGCR